MVDETEKRPHKKPGTMRTAIAEHYNYLPNQVDGYLADLLTSLKSPYKVIRYINETLGKHFYRYSIENWAKVRGWTRSGKGELTVWKAPVGWKRDSAGKWHPPIEKDYEPQTFKIPTKSAFDSTENDEN